MGDSADPSAVSVSAATLSAKGGRDTVGPEGFIHRGMETAEFHRHLRFASRCPSEQRHILFSALHSHALATYLHAVRSIDVRAATLVSSDGRSIAAVVTHIAAWDRWTLRAMREIASGSDSPGILTLDGYPCDDGRVRGFDSVDAFNEHAARVSQRTAWPTIREMAVVAGVALYHLCCDPAAVPAERLSATPPLTWRESDREVPREMPAGWLLWAKAIEHEGFSHIVDLESSADTVAG